MTGCEDEDGGAAVAVPCAVCGVQCAVRSVQMSVLLAGFVGSAYSPTSAGWAAMAKGLRRGLVRTSQLFAGARWQMRLLLSRRGAALTARRRDATAHDAFTGDGVCGAVRCSDLTIRGDALFALVPSRYCLYESDGGRPTSSFVKAQGPGTGRFCCLSRRPPVSAPIPSDTTGQVKVDRQRSAPRPAEPHPPQLCIAFAARPSPSLALAPAPASSASLPQQHQQ